MEHGLETPSHQSGYHWALPRWAAALLALVLVMPLVLDCFLLRGLPALATLAGSFTRQKFLGGGGAWVGLANYSALFGLSGLGAGMGFGFALGIARSVCGIGTALALALALKNSTRNLERIVGPLAALPFCVWFPLPLWLGWSSILRPMAQSAAFADAGGILPLAITVVDSLAFTGLCCAFLLPLALGALRPGNCGKGGDVSTLVCLGALALIAIMAMSLQYLEPGFILGRNFSSKLSLGLSAGYASFYLNFAAMQLGPGMAFSSIYLVILGLLGLGACLLIVLSGISLDLPPFQPALTANPTSRSNTPKIILGGIAALILLAALSICLIPIFGVSPKGMAPLRPGLGNYMATYLVPPSLVFLIQMPLAWLAALAIGGLRPLGRHSEWLLMIFAPLLLVQTWPLASAFWLNAPRGLRMNQGFMAYALSLVNLPLTFVLSLYFKGAAARCAALGQHGPSGFFKGMVLPSLPLSALLGLLSTASIQTSFYAFHVFMNKNESLPLNALAMRAGAMMGPNQAMPWLQGQNIVLALVCLVGLILFWFLYSGRISVKRLR